MFFTITILKILSCTVKRFIDGGCYIKTGFSGLKLTSHKTWNKPIDFPSHSFFREHKIANNKKFHKTCGFFETSEVSGNLRQQLCCFC